MILAGLALKPSAALSVVLFAPDIALTGALKRWPNAIPSLTSALLFGAGAYIVLAVVIDKAPVFVAWIMGGMWISGAGMMADRPLELVEWCWHSSTPAIAIFYVLAAIVIRSEWRYRRPFAMRLLYGVSWPWFDLVVPEPWIWIIGATGTACLALCAVESIQRYQPLEILP